jgi:hypothetical protein
MNVDKVTVRDAYYVNGDVRRAEWTREKGYEIVATPVGVVVKRGPECKVELARGEPDPLLIPWPLVSEPCPVSKEQSKK